MTEQVTEQVEVDISTDNAVLLLAAAHELGLDPAVIQVRGGKLSAPENVHRKAFEPRSEDEPKTVVKKSAPKKAQE